MRSTVSMNQLLVLTGSNMLGPLLGGVLIYLVGFSGAYVGLTAMYFIGLLLGYLSWLTKSIYPSILMHMAINGTSMLFIFLGENAENALLWKGHINPLLLILGAYTFWFSLKNMQFAYRK